MRRRNSLLVVLVALVALVVSACGSDNSADSSSSGDSQTIKIGYSGDFSGLLAAYDTPLRDGMQFAVDEINKSGGPYQVDLAVEDNKDDPQLTTSQTQAFLDDGRLINVIGTGDGRTAAASVVNSAGGLSLGALNTYPTFIDEAGPNSALLVVTDNIQAAASAQYACDQGYETVYTFASDDFAYSKNLPVYFADAFDHYCGGQVIGTGQFSLGQTDFGALITDLKGADPQPDAIYSPMFVPDSVAFVKQLRQAGVELPYLSSDANYLQDFIDSAGSSADGVVTAPYAFAGPGTALAQFQDDYEKATGKAVVTPLYEAIGRDQIYAVVAAAEKAGSTDPKAILDQFANLPADTFVAMQGAEINPDTHSPMTAKIPLVAIEGGEFKVVEELTPDYVPEPRR
jgi:branched-chain amino acid transport system substrate-binding protein